MILHRGAIVARTVTNNSKTRDKIPNYSKNRGGSNPKRIQHTPNNPKLNQKVAHCSHNPTCRSLNPFTKIICKTKNCKRSQRFLILHHVKIFAFMCPICASEYPEQSQRDQNQYKNELLRLRMQYLLSGFSASA